MPKTKKKRDKKTSERGRKGEKKRMEVGGVGGRREREREYGREKKMKMKNNNKKKEQIGTNGIHMVNIHNANFILKNQHQLLYVYL